MIKYRKVFGYKKRLFVVVHVSTNQGSVLKNIKIAIDSGVDGIFLISHGPVLDSRYLIDLANIANFSYPDLWIGINFLIPSIESSFKLLPDHVQGLWVDDAYISNDDYEKYCRDLRQLDSLRRELYDNVLYFGGVAFKYHNPPSNLASTASLAVRHVDVLTTSGDATGSPPSIEKIKTIRETIGYNSVLAIASGMTPENVSDYVDLTDCFLVSTGINKDFYNLDPKKVERFMKAIS